MVVKFEERWEVQKLEIEERRFLEGLKIVGWICLAGEAFGLLTKLLAC
jgi:hypothetical protein